VAAVLNRVDLREADLRDADLMMASLNAADVSGARLEGARFAQTLLGGCQGLGSAAGLCAAGDFGAAIFDEPP
jgi:uncharacterized protein YjbI with pentapeptide repeats